MSLKGEEDWLLDGDCILYHERRGEGKACSPAICIAVLIAVLYSYIRECSGITPK